MTTNPSARIVLFDDNPDFGGHQIMTNHALAGVLHMTQWQVLALGNPANAKLQAAWHGFQQAFPGRLCIEFAATHTRKLQSIRNHFEGPAQRRLLRQLAAFRPDLILCSQGNIEQCCTIFPLRDQLPCPLISYIPLPHGHAEMGAKFGQLRDIFCRPLYRQPSGFITLSPTLAQALRAKGAACRIDVVANGIPVERFPPTPARATARATLQLPANGYFWLLPGRTEFKQKGQDFALDVFLQRQHSHPDEHLIFLGSGPDSAALHTATSNLEQVHTLPWTDEPATVLAAADAVFLPSRYEGVPLVMLEALASGRPVCASDRDGMRDWLPSAWRFPYRDVAAAQRALDALRNHGAAHIDALQQRVRTGHSITDFQREFVAVLSSWLAAKPA
jgi:glycosyltransferase involved in cell wall biosynthesis